MNETAESCHHRDDQLLLDSMLMSSSSSDDEEQQDDYHEFTNEELNQLLYMRDDTTEPVQQYHYMKAEWLQDAQPQMAAVLQEANAHDNGHRTILNLDNENNAGQEPVFLDLDTQEVVHIIVFYVPWCPHCQVFKQHYMDVAQQVTRRRSIAMPPSAIPCRVLFLVS